MHSWVIQGGMMKYLVTGLLGVAIAHLAFAQPPAIPIPPEATGAQQKAVLGSPVDTDPAEGETPAPKPAVAQPAPVLPKPPGATDRPKPAVAAAPTVKCDFSGSCPPVPRIWGDAEYLLWWVKGAPVVPLVTTGSPADPVPGALGQPNTRVLLGNSPLEYGALSGARFALGGWLDKEGTVGVEVDGFFLQRGATSFGASSNGAGVPALYVPLIDRTPTSAFFNQQGSIAIADVPNAGLIGNTTVTSSINLWGTEANGVFNLVRNGGLSVDGLVGFRYLDLQENLSMAGNSIDITGAGINQSWIDSFSTRNQFYGGQLGLKLDYQAGAWSLEATGKVALGSTEQSSDVAGASVWSGAGFPFTPGMYRGGILTEPSNIGHQASSRFTVIPQVGLKVGYNLTSWAKLTAGYDFLYWSSVVRPGNQIDRNVNFTQIPGAQPFFGAPTPPAFPAPQFNRSDFSASGVSFGIEFSF
jgi:hypothetical protein